METDDFSTFLWYNKCKENNAVGHSAGFQIRHSVVDGGSRLEYADQWAYLSKIQKLSLQEVEDLIRIHSRGDGLGVLCTDADEAKPWEKRPKAVLTAMDFEQPIEIIQSNMLYIASDTLTPRVRNQMLRLAAFKNLDFYRSQAMRLPIYNKPRVVCTAEARDGCLSLPRGCEQSLFDLLNEANAEYKITDKTNHGTQVDFQEISFHDAFSATNSIRTTP